MVNFPRDSDSYPMYLADGTVINSYAEGEAYNAQAGASATNPESANYGDAPAAGATAAAPTNPLEGYGEGAFIGPDGKVWQKVSLTGSIPNLPQGAYGDYSLANQILRSNAVEVPGYGPAVPQSVVDSAIVQSGVGYDGPDNAKKYALMSGLAIGGAAALGGLGGAAAAPGSAGSLASGAVSAGAGGASPLAALGAGAVGGATGAGGGSGASAGTLSQFGGAPPMFGTEAAVGGAAGGLTPASIGGAGAAGAGALGGMGGGSGYSIPGLGGNGSTFGIPNNILGGVAQGVGNWSARR